MVMIRISWLSFLLIVTSTCVFAAENITVKFKIKGHFCFTHQEFFEDIKPQRHNRLRNS